MEHCILNAEYIGRRVVWASWLGDLSLFVLRDALRHSATQGCHPLMVERMLTQAASRPFTEQQEATCRKGLQRRIYSHLLGPVVRGTSLRARAKLARWNLPGFPRRHAQALLMNLSALKSRTPPRVRAALLSTAFNRWCTDRRFQVYPGRGCVLGCSEGQEDSIEHYCCCRVVRDAAASFLRLQLGPTPLGVFVGVEELQGQYQQATVPSRVALLVYATYRGTQVARGQGGLTAAVARDLLDQLIREGAAGHRRAERALRAL